MGKARRVAVAQPQARCVKIHVVQEVVDLRRRGSALRAELAQIEGSLRKLEEGIIADLESGVPLEPGCPSCVVSREERVVPRWKEECLALAQAAGHDPGVYEATVRARTKPTIIKRLVIEDTNAG